MQLALMSDFRRPSLFQFSGGPPPPVRMNDQPKRLSNDPEPSRVFEMRATGAAFSYNYILAPSPISDTTTRNSQLLIPGNTDITANPSSSIYNTSFPSLAQYVGLSQVPSRGVESITVTSVPFHSRIRQNS